MPREYNEGTLIAKPKVNIRPSSCVLNNYTRVNSPRGLMKEFNFEKEGQATEDLMHKTQIRHNFALSSIERESVKISLLSA